jgi:general secretion pathway protein J
MTRQRRSEKGFTLLELLISIAILSMILVALTGGLRFAGNAWRAQEERNARQSDIQAVQGVLRQMIASGKSFEGGPDGLRFVGRLPDALARGGLYDIELAAAGDKLTMSWQPHFKGPGGNLTPQEASLVDGIVTASFAYHIPQQGWQPAGSSKTKPVDMIGIKAKLSNNRVWPALVAAPMVITPPKPKS